MPAAIRKRGKTTKLAIAIMGVPQNMTRSTSEEKRIKRALQADRERYER